MNIAIYRRVSSKSQTKEGTIDSQIEALRDYGTKEKLANILIKKETDSGR